MKTYYQLAVNLLNGDESVTLLSADGLIKVMIDQELYPTNKKKPKQGNPSKIINIEIRRYLTEEKKQWTALIIDAREEGSFRLEFYIRACSLTEKGTPTDFRATKMSRTRPEKQWAKQCLADPTLRVTYRGTARQILRITTQPGDFGTTSVN